MATLKTGYREVQVSDGTTMQVYSAKPDDSQKHPGILIFQEGFGVNAHIRDVTERFARECWVALAPELYHRTAPGFEGKYDDVQAVMPHYTALTPHALEADVRAAYEALRSDPAADKDRVACVGFCMGGRVSFLANTVLPLQAAISFYGGGIAPSPMGPGLLDRAPQSHAPILLFWGGLDQHIPPEQHRAIADALRSAGKKYVNVEFSDADHGFFCDARASYNAAAASQAWALALGFLKTHVEP